MNEQLVNSYRFYLNTMSLDNLLIPDEFVEGFWTWFSINGKKFDETKIRKKLKFPNLKLFDNNSCFMNTYRILKAFRKRYYYYEGFAVQTNNNNYMRHAFNLSKNGLIIDYSLNYPTKITDINLFWNCYYGVKIPETFARLVYNKIGNKEQTQLSLLVPYYLYLNDFDDFFEYANL